MANVFGSTAMAAGYARSRPNLHARILELAVRRAGVRTPVNRAIDVGCGSGLSTLPLTTVASFAIGIEPNEAMARLGPVVAPAAHFTVGVAESLPLRTGTAGMVTAAGSLNYADPAMFFREALRVLGPGGILLIYDFSRGRRFRGADDVGAWFDEFMRRYPDPPNSALDINPEWLAASATGFRLECADRFEMAVSMTLESYIDYLMTETNVAHAIRGCKAEIAIRNWCRATLDPVFGGMQRDVLFGGYFACMVPARSETELIEQMR